jgi:stage V sporulation protein S
VILPAHGRRVRVETLEHTEEGVIKSCASTERILDEDQRMPDEGQLSREVLKVAAASRPVLVAGAIAGVIRSQGRVEVHAIGAAAVNQAIKAIAISRGYVLPAGLDLVCIPSFVDLSLAGQERTGIKLLVEVR